jgi:hypothetical protein
VKPGVVKEDIFKKIVLPKVQVIGEDEQKKSWNYQKLVAWGFITVDIHHQKG